MNQKKESDYDIPETKYRHFMKFLSLLLLIGMFLYLLIMWKQMPDKIPMHYNGAGEIDSYGGKYGILIIPILSALLYLGITFLERNPRVWNTGVAITKENKNRIYSTLKNMIVTLKFVMVLLFSFLTVFLSLCRPLPLWFTPASLIIIFGLLAYFSVLLHKKR